MDESIVPEESGKPKQVKPRMVLLTALCLFSFVYFGLLTLLFLFGLIYSGTIAWVISKYGPAELLMTIGIRTILSGAFLLHLLGFTGTIMMWNLRKTGYYLLVIACLCIASFQLLLPGTALISTAVYIIFIILFGVFFTRLN